MSKSRDIADSAATINYIDGLTSDAQGQLDDKATLDGSPTFTGTVTATSFSGDGSALTGVDSLPSQTGNNGKFLTTDGSAASWDAVDVSSEITGTLPVANGGTGAATLTANNVLLGNGTSAPLAVAPSTSGNVLTSNGTTWASTAPAGGGAMELLNTYTASNVANIEITDFSSTYDDYVIIVSKLTASDNSSLKCRFRIGGSIISSSYIWQYAYSQQTDTAIQCTGYSVGNSGTATNKAYSSAIINISSANDSVHHSLTSIYRHFLSGNMETGVASGFQTSTNGVLGGIQFFENTGNILTADFKIYGIKKS